jgi:orotate phosphoribosyltransferase
MLEPPAARTARLLLEIGAVLIRPDQPFTYTSGRLGPVYVDCRRVIAYPRARRAIIQMMAERVERRVGVESIEAVAGGETAGIPYAAWLSESLGLPMLYVRKKPKGFGRDAQIEGRIEPGQRVLLVEDLATDGGSKVVFVEALRRAEAICAHVIVVFYYGAYAGAADTLGGLGVSLHALATWDDVLAVAAEDGRLDDDAIATVRGFLADPVAWSLARGGKG